VLRLRAKEELGSTVVKLLIRYAERLAACDARLMLCGVTPGVRRQLDDTGLTAQLGEDAVFLAHARVGLSVHEAVEHAQEWIAAAAGAPPPPPAPGPGPS